MFTSQIHISHFFPWEVKTAKDGRKPYFRIDVQCTIRKFVYTDLILKARPTYVLFLWVF